MEKCNCAKEFKIPLLERVFMKNQQTHRKLYIGICNCATTMLMRKQFLRSQRQCEISQASSDNSQIASNLIKLPSVGFFSFY